MWFQESLSPSLVAIRIRKYKSRCSQSTTAARSDAMLTQTIELNSSDHSLFVVKAVEPEVIVILTEFAEEVTEQCISTNEDPNFALFLSRTKIFPNARLAAGFALPAISPISEVRTVESAPQDWSNHKIVTRTFDLANSGLSQS